MAEVQHEGRHRRRWLPDGLRPLAAAQLLSSVGSAMLLLCITYLAYSTSGSAFRTVLVSAVYVMPTVAFGFIAGRAAVEHDPARVVIASNVLKIFIYLAMAAANAAGLLDANTLLIFSVINGTVSTFTYPSWQSYLHGLVDEDHLSDLNATWTSIASLGTLVGAAAGGFVIAQFGETWVFAMNALTFLPLSLAIARTPSRRRARRHDGARHVRPREVIDHVRTEPALRQAIARVAVLSLLLAPTSNLLPAIANHLRPGPHMLGALTAVIGAGSAIVAWRLSRLKRRLDHDSLQRRFFVVASIFLLGLGLAGVIATQPLIGVLVIAALFAIGLIIAMAQSVLTAVVQINADPEMEGGVLAVLSATFAVFTSVGGLALSAAADVVDVFWVFIAAGLALGVHTVGMLARGRRATAPAQPTGDPA